MNIQTGNIKIFVTGVPSCAIRDVSGCVCACVLCPLPKEKKEISVMTTQRGGKRIEGSGKEEEDTEEEGK